MDVCIDIICAIGKIHLEKRRQLSFEEVPLFQDEKHPTPRTVEDMIEIYFDLSNKLRDRKDYNLSVSEKAGLLGESVGKYIDYLTE